jgi:menaquinone-9 beta-reductase
VREAIQSGAEFLPCTTAAVGDRAPLDSRRTVHMQSTDHRQVSARACVVLAADGLNQASHRKFDVLRGFVARSCRIGMGAVLPADDGNGVEPGTIEMAVGRDGYAGIVRTADDRINIAAAIDPAQLKTLSAADIIRRIRCEAGCSNGLEREIAAAEWRGTSPLTRSPRRVAVDNVLLLGDAAGYVEPFTGDGMAAAISCALSVERLVIDHLSAIDSGAGIRGVLDGNINRLSSEWIAAHGAIVRSARRRCRFLSALIRRPKVASLALGIVSAWPALARPFLWGRCAGESTY